MSLGENVICQVAIVVKDIEQASKNWAAALGVPVPQWKLTGPKEESHVNYRGGTTDGKAKLAFFSLGPQVNLELIEPVGGPSVWQEVLDEKGECVHHIAFKVKGMDGVLAKLAASGSAAIQRGDFPGGRYGYVDSAKQLGVVLELLEDMPR